MSNPIKLPGTHKSDACFFNIGLLMLSHSSGLVQEKHLGQELMLKRRSGTAPPFIGRVGKRVMHLIPKEHP